MLKKVSLGVLSVVVSLSFANSGQAKAVQSLHFKNSTLKTSNLKALTSNGFSVSPENLNSTKYYIVQFEGVSSHAFRSSISKIANIVRYVPDNAFVVELKTSSYELGLNPNVFWFGPYTPQLKVDQALLENPSNQKILVDVHLFSRKDEGASEKVKAAARKVLEVSPGLLKVETTVSDLSRFAKIDGVEWIEEVLKPKLTVIENPVVFTEPLVPEATDFAQFDGYATGAKVMNVEGLHTMNINGGTEIVTITDSGLDKGDANQMHEDLRGRIAGAYAIGRAETSEWDDPMGHGTHVAGLVAGDGSSSDGSVQGTAPKALLIMQSVFRWIIGEGEEEGKREKGMVLPSYIHKLFEGPYEDGSRVHTNSWQYTASSGQYDIQSALLDYFVWENPDYTVLFAAGNSGMDLDGDGVIDRMSISTPATAKNCITVGASENLIFSGGIQAPWSLLGAIGDGSGKSIWGAEPIASDLPSNNVDDIAAFSSRGPTQDGRIKPDIVAPGTNNISLRSRAPDMSPRDTWGVVNEDYVFMGGTSMATPLVAGAAALVREFYTQVEGRERVSAALVKATLIHGSNDLSGRPNFDQGFGRVDVENSLIAEGRVRKSFDETEGVTEGKTKAYAVTVTDASEPLRVTLTYSDFPASPSVAKALVNNLDLSVVDADGKVFYPNGLETADDVNNVEHIDIVVPRIGKYQVRVRGKSIPMGVEESSRQPYALVISGGLQPAGLAS